MAAGGAGALPANLTVEWGDVPMRLRIAVSSDALGIPSVQVAAWRAAYRGLMDPSLLDSLDPAARTGSWETLVAAPDHGLFVVEHDRRIRGYAHICASRDDSSAGTGEVASL